MVKENIFFVDKIHVRVNCQLQFLITQYKIS